MLSRRSYLTGLGSLGSVLGLVGCLGDEPTATETATGSSTETPTPASQSFGNEATVGEIAVTPLMAHPQSSFLYISNVDWADVKRLEDEWLVFVKLFVSGESENPPPWDSFRLVAGDDSFPAVETVDEAPLDQLSADDAVDTGPYWDRDGSTGWVAFVVPTEFDSASDLTFRVDHEGDTAQWSLPEKVTDHVASTHPTFEVVSFDTPKRVLLSDTADVTVTVENTSDVDGVFRGCVNTSGLYAFYEIELATEAGSEATWTEELRPADYAPDASTFGLYLRTTSGDEKRTIDVDEQDETSADGA
ncbi:hypothetical protein SAMN04487949_0649 [Halogranum gelatinilyticum]|uniref:Uncharacterized protein n=1 Tax=Halogranum gelatinilyticum TaxID=660521 RepID=A0A1G9Q1S8_9EURY|nr:hypothetical protein [Halogranum gelatinilyticum]SDM04946.1 hypothetical protein SAMN04487949_0649 [Halogranum gelatinilyticum]